MSHPHLSTLAYFASLAPSSHNTQPWRFRVASQYVDVVADLSRRLPENDPAGRELIISCGCALMNLRLAAAHYRLVPEVDYHPDFGHPEVLARIQFTPTEATEEEPELFDAIQRRRTHRGRFERRDIAATLTKGLEDAATREGAWLTSVTDSSMRHALGQLVAEGDAAQWARPRWRAELATWLRPRSAGDGLPTNAFMTPVTRLLVRSVNLGRVFGKRNRVLTDHSPMLAILGTYGDAEADWLVAGQALQRTLLWGCANGLQASFLNEAVQEPALRDKLAHLLGVAGFPQVVLRFGYPTEPPVAAPKRKLEDVAQIL